MTVKNDSLLELSWLLLNTSKLEYKFYTLPDNFANEFLIDSAFNHNIQKSSTHARIKINYYNNLGLDLDWAFCYHHEIFLHVLTWWGFVVLFLADLYQSSKYGRNMLVTSVPMLYVPVTLLFHLLMLTPELSGNTEFTPLSLPETLIYALRFGTCSLLLEILFISYSTVRSSIYADRFIFFGASVVPLWFSNAALFPWICAHFLDESDYVGVEYVSSVFLIILLIPILALPTFSIYRNDYRYLLSFLTLLLCSSVSAQAILGLLLTPSEVSITIKHFLLVLIQFPPVLTFSALLLSFYAKRYKLAFGILLLVMSFLRLIFVWITPLMPFDAGSVPEVVGLIWVLLVVTGAILNATVGDPSPHKILELVTLTFFPLSLVPYGIPILYLIVLSSLFLHILFFLTTSRDGDRHPFVCVTAILYLVTLSVPVFYVVCLSTKFSTFEGVTYFDIFCFQAGYHPVYFLLTLVAVLVSVVFLYVLIFCISSRYGNAYDLVSCVASLLCGVATLCTVFSLTPPPSFWVPKVKPRAASLTNVLNEIETPVPFLNEMQNLYIFQDEYTPTVRVIFLITIVLCSVSLFISFCYVCNAPKTLWTYWNVIVWTALSDPIIWFLVREFGDSLCTSKYVTAALTLSWFTLLLLLAVSLARAAFAPLLWFSKNYPGKLTPILQVLIIVLAVHLVLSLSLLALEGVTFQVSGPGMALCMLLGFIIFIILFVLLAIDTRNLERKTGTRNYDSWNDLIS